MHTTIPKSRIKVNEDVLKKTVRKCKERNIIIPTFVQLKESSLIPASIKKGLWEIDPINLFRINWLEFLNFIYK